jgi:hypothetical protein
MHLCKDISVEDDPSKMISKSTQKKLGKMWLENFADNMPAAVWARVKCNRCDIEYEVNTWEERERCRYCSKSDMEVLKTRNIHEFGKLNGTAGIVIGAGPSVRPELGSKHLDMIAQEWKGATVVCDRMTIPCLEHGIIPTVIGSVDGSRDHIIKWFKDPIVEEYGDQLHVFCGTTVAHNVIEYLLCHKVNVYFFNPLMDHVQNVIEYLLCHKVNVYFFNPLMDHVQSRTSMTYRMANMNGITCMSAGGNIGSGCMVIGYYLHLNPIGLVGIDFGYRKDDPIENTAYYSALMKGTGGVTAHVEKLFKHIHHPFFKTDAITDTIFWYYREAFLGLVLTTKNYRVVNCTEGGTLFGQGMECMWLQDYIDEFSEAGVPVPETDRWFAPPEETFVRKRKKEEDDENS